MCVWLASWSRGSCGSALGNLCGISAGQALQGKTSEIDKSSTKANVSHPLGWVLLVSLLIPDKPDLGNVFEG